jgi:L-aspartate oxidase
VFGARAGKAMREFAGAPAVSAPRPPEPRFPCMTVEELRELAWQSCGIVRSGPVLEQAVERLAGTPLNRTQSPDRALFELRSIHNTLALIARSALARRESRGAHYRSDFSKKETEFQKHSVVSLHHDVTFR